MLVASKSETLPANHIVGKGEVAGGVVKDELRSGVLVERYAFHLLRSHLLTRQAFDFEGGAIVVVHLLAYIWPSTLIKPDASVRPTTSSSVLANLTNSRMNVRRNKSRFSGTLSESALFTTSAHPVLLCKFLPPKRYAGRNARQCRDGRAGRLGNQPVVPACFRYSIRSTACG